MFSPLMRRICFLGDRNLFSLRLPFPWRSANSSELAEPAFGDSIWQFSLNHKWGYSQYGEENICGVGAKICVAPLPSFIWGERINKDCDNQLLVKTSRWRWLRVAVYSGKYLAVMCTLHSEDDSEMPMVNLFARSVELATYIATSTYLLIFCMLSW